MNYRLHALRVIAIKRRDETLVSPSFYIMVSASFIIAYFFIAGFIGMIGSDGINPAKSPVYGLVINLLKGVFGNSFIDRLFAQGPFLIALFLSAFVFILYMGISTVSQFGHEKGSGALEVISSGPADETACFLGYFATNLVFTIAFLVSIAILFFIAALLTNLALSGIFFFTIFLLVLGSIVVYAYASLASVLARNSFGALAFFLVFLLFFAGAQFGMYGTITGSGNKLTGTLSFIVQWISPFFALNSGSEAAEYGSIAHHIRTVLDPIIVSVIILFASHVISRTRGVRV
jgi:hypothetical protein